MAGATRDWKAPPVEGYTIQLINDLHTVDTGGSGGARNQALQRDLPLIGPDVTNVDLRVQAGDAIHNMNSGDYAIQMPIAKTVFDLLRADGIPLLYSVGNHECNYSKTGTQAKTNLGFTDPLNYTAEYGPFKFILYSPVNSSETGSTENGTTADWTIPSSVLTWMDTEMGNTTKPVVFVSHCPLGEHFGTGTTGFFLQPHATITDMIASHSNVVAHMCGHRHRWFDDDQVIKSANFGSHTVALMTGGTCGGELADANPLTDHPVCKGTYMAYRPNGSTFATYFDGTEGSGPRRWECRWRDHSIGQWGCPETPGEYMKTITL